MNRLLLTGCSTLLGMAFLGAASSAVGARLGTSDLADGLGETVNKSAQLTAETRVAPEFATPPAGTTLYYKEEVCRNISSTSTDWLNVFPTAGDISFYTGEASSVVEINFSSQASIGSGTADNRIYFKCSISQDTGSTWTNCSGQNATNGLVFARRIKDVNSSSTTYQVSTNPGVYIGYAGVSPGTETKLRLQVRYQNAEGTTATVCYPNLIVRY